MRLDRLSSIDLDYDAAVVPEDDVDATKFVATALVIRALRGAGLHHVLAGAPCTFAIVGVDPSVGQIVADATRDLLKRCGRGQPGYYTSVHDHTGPTRRLSWSVDSLVESLQNGTRLCCIHHDVDTVPSSLASVADGIAVFPKVDAELVKAATLKAIGKMPSKHELEILACLPLSLLAVALKTGRSMAQGTALARRITDARAVEDGKEEKETSPSASDADVVGPSLEDLHGLGEAGEWGRSLALDLADYRAGEIEWNDVDRGALVSGPPGTGKTTFALALGRSCGVPVHVHSFARWQAAGHLNDMLKAMRGAFKAAMAAAPCVLFVDEVDSVGDRAKTDDHNSGYIIQVVNAFLECLDGAEARTGVVVVGATNHPDLIDPAVRRPGRLDRDIRIPMPDGPARLGILRYHLKDALLGTDLMALATRLEGACGADLERAVRDARRHARRARRDMSLSDLEAALPVMERMSDALFRRACIHEAGHFVVGHALASRSGSTPIFAHVAREVSSGPLGVTEFHRQEGFDSSRDSYLAEICVLLAGAAAEEEILGHRGTGSGGAAGSDLHRATALATAMEASYGLGDTLLPCFDPFSDTAVAVLARDPAMAAAVERFLSAAYAESQRIVNHCRNAIGEAANFLATIGRVETAPLSVSQWGLPEGSQGRPAAPSDPSCGGAENTDEGTLSEVSIEGLDQADWGPQRAWAVDCDGQGLDATSRIRPSGMTTTEDRTGPGCHHGRV